MKGLKEYIKKHGKHFTERLAEDALRWDSILFWETDKVMKALNRKVWYNVQSLTIGDIVYLVNNYPDNLNNSIKCTISRHLHSVYPREEAFSIFISSLYMRERCFDFTPYI